MSCDDLRMLTKSLPISVSECKIVYTMIIIIIIIMDDNVMN